MKKLLPTLFVLILCALDSFAQAPRVTAPGINLSPVPLWPADGDLSGLPSDQYVFFDPRSAEWVVSYPQILTDPQSERVTLRFGSHAEVAPSIVAHGTRQSDGSYSYSYVVENAETAHTPIQKWTLVAPAEDTKFAAKHPTWKSHPNVGTEARDIMPSPTPLVAVEWSATDTTRVAAHTAIGAFSVTSTYSPGFTTASFRGSVKNEYTEEVAATLPKPVADQLAKVLTPAWDSQLRLTLGPRFAPDTTKTVIAANFHYGISALARRGALHADSAFVSGALEALGSFLTSNGASSLDPESLSFLSQAAPGVETEIANALRWSLAGSEQGVQ